MADNKTNMKDSLVDEIISIANKEITQNRPDIVEGWWFLLEEFGTNITVNQVETFLLENNVNYKIFEGAIADILKNKLPIAKGQAIGQIPEGISEKRKISLHENVNSMEIIELLDSHLSDKEVFEALVSVVGIEDATKIATEYDFQNLNESVLSFSSADEVRSKLSSIFSKLSKENPKEDHDSLINKAREYFQNEAGDSYDNVILQMYGLNESKRRPLNEEKIADTKYLEGKEIKFTSILGKELSGTISSINRKFEFPDEISSLEVKDLSDPDKTYTVPLNRIIALNESFEFMNESSDDKHKFSIEVSVRDARLAMDTLSDMIQLKYSQDGSNCFLFKKRSHAEDALDALKSQNVEILEENIDSSLNESKVKDILDSLANDDIVDLASLIYSPETFAKSSLGRVIVNKMNTAGMLNDTLTNVSDIILKYYPIVSKVFNNAVSGANVFLGESRKIKDTKKYTKIFESIDPSKLKDGKITTYADMLVVNDEGRVLLLKRNPESGFEPNKWGFAGGKVMIGETTEEGAIRECKEESGIIIDPLSVSKLDEIVNDDDMNNISVSHYFTGRPTNDVVLGDEHNEYDWISLGDLTEYELICDNQERYEDLVVRCSDPRANLNEGANKDAEMFASDIISFNYIKSKEDLTIELDSEKSDQIASVSMSYDSLGDHDPQELVNFAKKFDGFKEDGFKADADKKTITFHFLCENKKVKLNRSKRRDLNESAGSTRGTESDMQKVTSIIEAEGGTVKMCEYSERIGYYVRIIDTPKKSIKKILEENNLTDEFKIYNQRSTSYDPDSSATFIQKKVSDEDVKWQADREKIINKVYDKISKKYLTYDDIVNSSEKYKKFWADNKKMAYEQNMSVDEIIETYKGKLNEAKEFDYLTGESLEKGKKAYNIVVKKFEPNRSERTKLVSDIESILISYPNRSLSDVLNSVWGVTDWERILELDGLSESSKPEDMFAKNLVLDHLDSMDSDDFYVGDLEEKFEGLGSQLSLTQIKKALGSGTLGTKAYKSFVEKYSPESLNESINFRGKTFNNKKEVTKYIMELEGIITDAKKHGDKDSVKSLEDTIELLRKETESLNEDVSGEDIANDQATLDTKKSEKAQQDFDEFEKKSNETILELQNKIDELEAKKENPESSDEEKSTISERIDNLKKRMSNLIDNISKKKDEVLKKLDKNVTKINSFLKESKSIKLNESKIDYNALSEEDRGRLLLALGVDGLTATRLEDFSKQIQEKISGMLNHIEKLNESGKIKLNESKTSLDAKDVARILSINSTTGRKFKSSEISDEAISHMNDALKTANLLNPNFNPFGDDFEDEDIDDDNYDAILGFTESLDRLRTIDPKLSLFESFKRVQKSSKEFQRD